MNTTFQTGWEMGANLVSFYTMDEAAKRLGRSRRWLQGWLRDNPTSESGMPYHAQAGRTKLLTDENIRWITAALKEQAIKRFGKNETAKNDLGVVYFIESGDFVKIGYTRCPQERAKKMFTDCPIEPRLLHAEPGTFKSEKTLHRHFAHLHARGEWFRKGPDLLEYIEQRKQIA
jgi:Meiotically Up-regulated Gene 113 (MUG113) protein